VKTTSPLTATLFLGVAAAVGAAAWLLSGSDDGDIAAAPIERPSTDRPQVGFVAVSPKEQRKKSRLEATQRQLKRMSVVGSEISPGLYMIPDSSGDPTYYSTELIEGRGRNGEALYMTAEFRKVHSVPLRDGKEFQKLAKTRLNPKAPKATLSFGKKKGGDAPPSDGPTPTGSSGGPAGGGGSDALSGGQDG
jgi:hypothetical protein